MITQVYPDSEITDEDLIQLRKCFDTSESFMKGFQIIQTRRPERDIPSWTTNDKFIQQLLLRVFPKLHTDPKQRRAAGSWSRIIYLYFRVQYNDGEIAEEMNMTITSVRQQIYRIKKTVENMQTVGNRAPNTQKGRPKKVYR